jgi:hypothetical protein
MLQEEYVQRLETAARTFLQHGFTIVSVTEPASWRMTRAGSLSGK